MKLVELFLKETTEEDRAILSLSSAISRYIEQYNTDADSEVDNEYDEYDDEDLASDKPLLLGTVGELFNTPLTGLSHIKIELQNDYGIRLGMKKDTGKLTGPEDELTYGMWEPSRNTIVLNRDFIGTNRLKTVVSHELRHALDDVKSEYRATSSARYMTPKKKEHKVDEPGGTKYSYLAQPAEINARFLEVLHLLVATIQRASKDPNTDLTAHAMSEFKRFLAAKSIAKLFPEGTASKDYQRLVKRGVDFITKEVAHRTKK